MREMLIDIAKKGVIVSIRDRGIGSLRDTYKSEEVIVFTDFKKLGEFVTEFAKEEVGKLEEKTG